MLHSLQLAKILVGQPQMGIKWLDSIRRELAAPNLRTIKLNKSAEYDHVPRSMYYMTTFKVQRDFV